jgi:type I restriction enzyme, S subunit
LPKGLDLKQKVSFVPMAAVSEEGQLVEHETRVLADTKKGYTYFERGDVIVAKITPCFENGKAALVDGLPHEIGFGSTEFHVLRPDSERLDAKFLFYLVWNDRFRSLGRDSMQGAAGQKRVSADFIRRYEIPLPSLAEQRRIAKILDKIESLRRKRKQAIELAEKFLQSVFLEMFGDLGSNPRNWNTLSMGGLINVGPTNGIYKPASEYGEGCKILRIDGFYDGKLGDPQTFKRVRLSDKEIKKYRLSDGSIVINRVNSREYLGKCALIKGLVESTVFESNMMNFSVDEKLAVPRFIVDQLCSRFVKNQILTYCKDAVNQSSINQQDVKSIQVRLPPVRLQRKYEEIAKHCFKSVERMREQLDDLQRLYRATAHSVFNGIDAE